MANEGPDGGADGAVLEALPGGGTGGPAWWRTRRPCLVEALPGGGPGGPAWWRMSVVG